MTNEQIRQMLTYRVKYENEIKALGGKIPAPWPWDDTGELRNVQLLETLEDLKTSLEKSKI